jgi:hypothetical protein
MCFGIIYNYYYITAGLKSFFHAKGEFREFLRKYVTK